jgi:hypothetical protein
LLGSANIKLTIDDKEKCFDGYIYSDKQWGSLLIQDWVKYWIWLHIVDTDGSHSVLFRTVDQNDEEKNHSAGSRIRLSKLPESFLSNPLQNHSLVASPNNISLSTRDIMRSRIDENYDYFSATYIRWGITNGLFEFMKIKK